MRNRYLRNKDMIDQNKLDELTIIGAGGVGSSLVINAAIMGFKKIHIWDFDVLEEHNLSTTMYPESCLGKPKTAAAKSVASYFNSKCKIITHTEAWTPEKPLTNKVMMAPDNMEVRLAVWNSWKDMNEKIFLIDMRMGAVTMEVITCSPKKDIFFNTWKPSIDIADEPCTEKHTIFTASIISGLGLSAAFNVLHNRPYYSYIWKSLSPSSFRKEHLVLNEKGVTNETRSQKEKSSLCKPSNTPIIRSPKSREDNNVVKTR